MDLYHPTMRALAMACFGYSSDPVHDASRHSNAADDLEQRRDAKRADIVRMFTQDVRVVGPNNVIVPSAVTHREQKPEWHSVSANMLDLLSYDDIRELFDAVLQSSDCPLVAALRKGAAERYADQWVDDLVAAEDA